MTARRRCRHRCAPGSPTPARPGVEHDVINPKAFEFVFVEIEIKAQG
jgi:hypothetical protein